MSMFCSRECAVVTCPSCRELQVLQGEVDAAEVALRNAKRRRAIHLSAVNARRSAVTRLPTEIVRYIIQLYVDLPEQELDPTEYASYPALERPRWFRAVHRSVPLSLGAISRQWRTVAWSFPDLWSTIVIPLTCRGHHLGPEMVSEWLKRSGQRPLAIQINDPKEFHNSADREGVLENGKAIIRVLNQHSTRWQTLDFSECPLDILDALDSNGQSGLRHLSIGGLISDSHHFYDNDRARPIFHKAACMHKPTHLNIIGCVVEPKHLMIKWSSLTHLHLENIGRAPFFKMLEYIAPHITHLSTRTIYRFDDNDLFWEAGEPIEMPSLVALSIDEYDCAPNQTGIFFDNIVTPALRTMSYNGRDSYFIFPSDQFAALMLRSGCRLKELNLENTVIIDEVLEELLRPLSNLERLKIRLTVENDTSHLLRCLWGERLETDPTPFLPHLRLLDIAAYMPTAKWRDFLAIYGTPKTHVVSSASTHPALPVPARRNLRVRFTVRHRSRYGNHVFPGDDSLMEWSLVEHLVFLWRTFGVVCVFQFEDDNFDAPQDHIIRPFLENSYSHNPFSWQAFDAAREMQMRKDISAMMKLEV